MEYMTKPNIFLLGDLKLGSLRKWSELETCFVAQTGSHRGGGMLSCLQNREILRAWSYLPREPVGGCRSFVIKNAIHSSLQRLSTVSSLKSVNALGVSSLYFRQNISATSFCAAFLNPSGLSNTAPGLPIGPNCQQSPETITFKPPKGLAGAWFW